MYYTHSGKNCVYYIQIFMVDSVVIAMMCVYNRQKRQLEMRQGLPMVTPAAAASAVYSDMTVSMRLQVSDTDTDTHTHRDTYKHRDMSVSMRLQVSDTDTDTHTHRDTYKHRDMSVSMRLQVSVGGRTGLAEHFL